jgi:glycosyltransferase involved in cell wall biosynthesis
LLRLARARIVASSEPDRTTLLGHVPALTRRTVTLENGVDLSSLLRLERDPQPGALIVVGRLTPSKGVDDLLRALAHLTVTDWQLDVWGTEESGERLRLSLIVRSLGLEDRVVFHGAFNSDQLHHSLARASLAIFPSRAEGFGLALLEALAAGTPVLASDIPAHRALLGPDLADRVVDLTSPGAAAEEIVRHLTAAPATTTSLTERERARARSYDVGRLKRDIDALYIQLGLGI